MSEKMMNDQVVGMERDNSFWEDVYNCMEALHCHKDEAIKYVENTHYLQLQFENSPSEVEVEEEIEEDEESDDIEEFDIENFSELSKYFE